MNRHRISTMLAGSLSAVLFATTVSCGGEHGTREARKPPLLELRSVDRAGELPPVRLVRRFLPAADGELWTVQADERQLVASDAAEPGGTALRLSCEDRAVVRIEGPFRAEDFNQVAIRLDCPGMVELALSLCKSTGVDRRIAKCDVRSRGEPITLVLDVPAARGKPGQELPAIDAIELAVLEPVSRLEIAAVDLLFRPWERWLPDVTASGALVILQEEARSAVGLVRGKPLECDLVPPEGAQLSYACGIPEYLPVLRGRLEVVMELFEGERRVARERTTLGASASGPNTRWVGTTIDLSAWAGRALRAEFSLQAPDGSDALCALTPPHFVQRGSPAPTVLLVTSDTHRADHLGCAPDTVGVQTPTLDALAASGLLFEDCFSQVNGTRPSHAALMTAMHPRDHGLTDNVSRLSEAATTLAERFRSAGYLTFAAVSATPVSPIDSGLDQGFVRYSYSRTQERSSTEAIADVLSWMRDAEGVPLFVWLHVFDAHAPYAPPADLADLYVSPGGPGNGARQPLPEGLKLSWRPKVADLAGIAASYKSEVTGLDRELAPLFSEPRLAGAITAFTADHGESMTAHGIYFTHSGLYTDTVHVPLILRWPGGPRGERVARPVQQMDVGRTLLDLAGLADVEFPGTDLLDEDAAPRPRFTLSANGWSAGVTLGGWHLLVQLRNREPQEDGHVLSPRGRHQTELYHLVEDPRCERDVVEEHLDQARKLRAMLVQWLLAAPTDTLSERQAVADSETMEELEALGYTTDVESQDSNVWWDPACACVECKKFE